MSRTIEFTKAGGPDVLELIETKPKAPGPRGQTEIPPTKTGELMRAMRAEQFSGYEALKLVELPKPAVSDGRALLRMTAAGVTPLDHTILSGRFHGSKAPLVLGNE